MRRVYSCKKLVTDTIEIGLPFGQGHGSCSSNPAQCLSFVFFFPHCIFARLFVIFVLGFVFEHLDSIFCIWAPLGSIWVPIGRPGNDSPQRPLGRFLFRWQFCHLEPFFSQAQKKVLDVKIEFCEKNGVIKVKVHRKRT